MCVKIVVESKLSWLKKNVQSLHCAICDGVEIFEKNWPREPLFQIIV